MCCHQVQKSSWTYKGLLVQSSKCFGISSVQFSSLVTSLSGKSVQFSWGTGAKIFRSVRSIESLQFRSRSLPALVGIHLPLSEFFVTGLALTLRLPVSLLRLPSLLRPPVRRAASRDRGVFVSSWVVGETPRAVSPITDTSHPQPAPCWSVHHSVAEAEWTIEGRLQRPGT